ncbi:MAG TPA: caspase family protein [Candidatus Tectomicrobia bacterium]
MQPVCNAPQSLGRARTQCGRRLQRFRPALLAVALTSVLSLCLGSTALAQRSMTPVREEHLQQIRSLFRARGLQQANVVLDTYGRVALQGTYEKESEADLAFSLAQTVVGVRWVSPVTPERIKDTAFGRSIQDLFGRQPHVPGVSPDTPPGPVQRKYALVVGVGQFQDTGINRLRYPAKDAEDFYKYLLSPSGGKFRPQDVTLLRDGQATRGAVLQALDRIKAQAGPDDLVILYLSSHGTPPDKFGGVHMITYDTVVKPREQVWQTSVNEEALRLFIQDIRAKRLIIILDTCYSNGAYARVPGFLPVGGKSLGSDEDEGYGRSRQYMAQRLLGMKDLVVESPARPPAAAVGRQGWGKVLISASDAGERSWEFESLKNSVFTYYFLDGLNRHRGSVKAAFDYARPLVLNRVQVERGGETRQTPQVTSNQPEWDMSIAGGV